MAMPCESRSASPIAGPAVARRSTAGSSPRPHARVPAAVSLRAAPTVRSTRGGGGVSPRLASSSPLRPSPRVRVGASSADSVAEPPAPGTVALVLLSGGVGKRMGAPIPKQYLELRGRPVAAWALRALSRMPEVGVVVIVCEESYEELFRAQWDELWNEVADQIPGGTVAGTEAAYLAAEGASGSEVAAVASSVRGGSGPSASSTAPRTVAPELIFARPGAERQDSVRSGLLEIDQARFPVVAVHDSARPLVQPEDVRRCLLDASAVGAAVLAVPCKATVKRVGSGGLVKETLQRGQLWEAQTPQIAGTKALLEASKAALASGRQLTDDVALLEARGSAVKVTPGSYSNLKITTPEDLEVAEKLLDASLEKNI